VPAFIAAMKAAISIDEHKLDLAVKWQVELVSRINDVYAITMSRRDEAKTRLKEVEAELDELIRREMVKEGQKVTETQVKNLIIRHRDFTTQMRRLNFLEEDTARLAGVKDNYKDRSYMVREMVSLHLSGYFADLSGRPRDVPSVNGRREDVRRYERNRD
jgi:hypothetical protein